MKKFIFLYAFLCLFLPLAAQINSYPHFTNISTKDGLPDNDIFNIYQDKVGYLWFGSYSALIRYDGYNFKVYTHDPDNPHSPPKGVLCSMAEDIYGNCWVASDVGGLVKFNQDSQIFTQYRFLPGNGKLNISNGICALLTDNKGNLWISIRNGQVEKINIKTWKIQTYSFLKAEDGYLRLDKLPFCKDSKDNIWVGFKKYNESKDIFEFQIETGQIKEWLKGRYISCMAIDDSDNIWYTCKHEIIKYIPGTGSLKEYVKWKGDRNFLNMALDNRNRAVWTSSNTFGLCKMDQKTRKIKFYLPDIKNKYDNVIHSIYFDAQHNLWAANGGGLHKLASISQNFKQYAIDPLGKEGITRPIIRSLWSDSNVLWVGTRGGGLNKVTLNEEPKYENFLLEPISREYGNNFVNFISAYHNKELLLGTNTGLYFFNSKTNKVRKHLALLDSKRPFDISLPYTVWAVLEDTGQNLWIGTQSAGLFLYNTKTGKIKTLKQGGPNRNVTSHAVWFLFRDRHKNIWGGSDTGIFKICRNAKGDIYFQQFAEQEDKKGSYQGQDAWQIYEDEDGIFWIASIGGLNRFDPNTGLFKCYTVKDGLPSNSVGGILAPKKDLFLISTLKGLCVFDRKLNKGLNTFYESDGLQSDHLGFRACVQSSSGEIFLAGQNGFNSLFLKDIRNEHEASAVVITSFKKYYKDFTAALLKNASIELNYDENSISFDFAVLDYTNPSKNQFSYYLEGVENNWSVPSCNHFAGYNYLPPGEYIFHLKGKNSANVWSAPVSFSIIIKPAFWNRLWFRLTGFFLLSLFLGGFLYSLIKQQNEKRKRLESDLTALRAQLNPHFIFNSLSSLHYFITTHKEILALEYVSNFAMLIRMILSNSQSSYVFLADEIKFLRLYIYMESVRFDNMIDFEIKIAPTVHPDTLKMPPMLIQPLIENAMKHGLLGTRQNGKVTISFSMDEHNIYCMVEDNGVGLVQAEVNKKGRFINFPSFSTHSIHERLQKIKDRAGKRGSLTLENIEQDGHIIGVRATLKIPKVINNISN